MTRAQLTVLSVVSALCTIAVLAGGAVSSGPDAALTAALRKPVTVTAALPAAAPVAEPAAAEPVVEPVADVTPVDQPATVAPDPVSEPPATQTPAAEAPAEAPVAPAAPEPAKGTQVEHVFQIVLAGRGFDAAFGPDSQAPYLAKELRPQGALLTNYRTLGSADLPDHLAFIGGQPPNADTRSNCPVFREIPPTAKPNEDGEITKSGCVFPNTVITLGDQLTASARTWRGYIEDLDKGTPPKSACRRPGSDAADDTLRARPGDGYATRHNPFVYYHSLLDLGDCDANDGPLARLETDLQAEKTTPNYAYIAPSLCNDGTETPCADGAPGGLPAADAFLATWVPKILASPAYKRNGLVIVTFAGNAAGPAAGAKPGDPVRQGTLLLSRFAQAGATEDAAHDPYSLLRSVQDLFGVKPLARSAKAPSFSETVLASARLARPGDD